MVRRVQRRGYRRIRRQRKKGGGRFAAWAGRFAKGLISLAMLASLTWLGFTLYQYVQRSGGLNIGEIKIMGCLNATEAELLKLAQVDFRANLVDLDLQQVSSRLARHPWIEKAKVRRDWPRRALVIEVQERKPRALILLDDLYLVDSQGEVFKKAESQDGLDLPVITGLNAKEVRARQEEAVSLIRQGLDFLDLMEKRKVMEISEVHLSKRSGLTVYTLNGGIPIRLGTGDFDDKLSRLEKVLPDIRQKIGSVESIDLNYAKELVVKMKEAGKEKSRTS